MMGRCCRTYISRQLSQITASCCLQRIRKLLVLHGAPWRTNQRNPPPTNNPVCLLIQCPSWLTHKLSTVAAMPSGFQDPPATGLIMVCCMWLHCWLVLLLLHLRA
jgi:hypothetical protein